MYFCFKIKVSFNYRLGFQYGANGCNTSNTGSYVTALSSETWYCTSGCNGTRAVTDNSYYCTDADGKENWETGEKVFTFTAPGKQFTIG